MNWIRQWRYLVAGVIVSALISGVAVAAGSSRARTNVSPGASTARSTTEDSSAGLTNAERDESPQEASDADALQTNAP